MLPSFSSDYNTQMDTGGAQRTALGIILFLLLLVVCVAVFMAWKDRKDTASSGGNEESRGSSAYFSIPEFGIRFKTSPVLADLRYQLSADGEWAYLYTDALIKAEEVYGPAFCNRQSGIGAIGITQMQVATGPRPFHVVALPSGLFAEYWHPQAVCTPYVEVMPMVLQQKAHLIEDFKTVEEINRDR